MLAVKGKKEAVSIYCLLGDRGKESKEFKELEKKHNKILEFYFDQKWKEALEEMIKAKTLL